jgi:hypothetical protein
MNPDEIIKTAVSRIENGENPEFVFRFVYNLGYTDGMLTMAGKAEEQLKEVLKAA